MISPPDAAMKAAIGAAGAKREIRNDGFTGIRATDPAPNGALKPTMLSYIRRRRTVTYEKCRH